MKIYKLIVTTSAAVMMNISGSAFAADVDFPDAINTPNDAKVELGKLLMFDKILSGNKNISCATCHHSLTDTGDGLSLPVGEGGNGLGVTRNTGLKKHAVHERVPRNAPPVFNLGAYHFTVLFHDGRVSADDGFPSGCKTPAGHNLPDNLENVLACQAMFPVTSATEMAGQGSENYISKAAAKGDLAGPRGVWAILAKRLQRIPEYVDMFITAFDDISAKEDITYAHAANAIAAFEGVFWRADNSPYDQYLAGDTDAMSMNAQVGMDLFKYGSIQGGGACADCHSGNFQTDNGFHNIAMPQIGAGRGSNSPGNEGGHEDFGREQVTGAAADTLKFRTPTLRNVALTAPYSHAGAYNTLRAAVEHHLDPVTALENYDQSQAVLPSREDLDAHDFITMDNVGGRLDFMITEYEKAPMDLRYTPAEVDRILDFLNALTDTGSIDLRNDVPASVPSGLPMYD
jgi:cytochrome c peroxidase